MQVNGDKAKQIKIFVAAGRSIYTVFRKKVVYFVFEHNFTITGSIFLTIISDHYCVISLQVPHTAKNISGLK